MNSITRIVAALAAASALALIAVACGIGGDDMTADNMMMPSNGDNGDETTEPEPTEPETPRVTAALSAAEVEENGSATLTLTANTDLSAAATFNLSATQGVTFGEGNQSEAELTIAAGQRSASISVSTPDIADVIVERLDSVISVAAAAGAEVEFSDAMLPLVVTNPLPSGPPPTVEAELSARTIPEGGTAFLTITASAPLAETVTFFFQPDLGIEFDGGRRALQIPARHSSASIEVIAGEIPGNVDLGNEITINITADSEAVDFTSTAVSLLVDNINEFMLAEPVLEADGTMVRLRLEAIYEVEQTVSAGVDLPEGVFSQDRVTIRIAPGRNVGQIVLDVENAPEEGMQLNFNIRRGSIRGVEDYKVTEYVGTLIFRP